MLNKEILNEYFFGYLFDHPNGAIEFLSGFLPLIYSIVYFNSVWKYSKILIFYSICIFILEIWGSIYAANKISNHLIYLVFYLFETVLLSIFYLKAIQKPKYMFYIIIILLISLASILYNIFGNTPILDNFSGSIQSLSFVILTLICYYFILSKLELSSLKNSILFWINTGNLIYFSGRFFICLFLIEVLDPKINGLEGFWAIMSCLLLIQRVFLAIGISKTIIIN